MKNGKENRKRMGQITASELKRKLELGETVAVVDIREANEYSDWRIHGSLNMPVYDALNAGDVKPLRQRVAGLPDDRPIVAVCRRGNTSKIAAQMLESLGYDASSLIGGMRGWSMMWSEARIPLTGRKDVTFIQIRRNGKGCLSYLFGSNGQAAVVDPCVDELVYTEIAKREGLRITHVFDTHVHADHISRARALSKATDAELTMPANQRAVFSFHAIHDGQTIRIGDSTVEAITTPGHTDESMCYLIDGEALLTGDTLFVEGVGRPDLEKGNAGAERGARLLYRSLHERILKFSEVLRIYPAHYSVPLPFDGVAVAATLGELRSKLELLTTNEEEFVSTILSNLLAKPPNFHIVISINEGKTNSSSIDLLDLEAGPNRCAVAR